MRRLLFRPQARLDLLEIWHYIAKKSPGIASSVTNRIERDIRMLLAMPTMGHHRKDVSDPEIRFWSVYSYIVAYRFDDQQVMIIRIIHGARDFRKLFKK